MLRSAWLSIRTTFASASTLPGLAGWHGHRPNSSCTSEYTGRGGCDGLLAGLACSRRIIKHIPQSHDAANPDWETALRLLSIDPTASKAEGADS